MQEFVELLKIFLPSVVVFFTAWVVLREFFHREERKRQAEVKQIISKDALLLRLQAYERLILLMERISPSSIVLRLNKSNLKAGEFHQQLLATVKAEFEHNIAQQLYVPHNVWQMVCASKEEILRLFNTSREKCSENESLVTLAKIILSDGNTSQELISKTIGIIKEEAQKLF